MMTSKVVVCDEVMRDAGDDDLHVEVHDADHDGEVLEEEVHHAEIRDEEDDDGEVEEDVRVRVNGEQVDEEGHEDCGIIAQFLRLLLVPTSYPDFALYDLPQLLHAMVKTSPLRDTPETWGYEQDRKF